MSMYLSTVRRKVFFGGRVIILPEQQKLLNAFRGSGRNHITKMGLEKKGDCSWPCHCKGMSPWHSFPNTTLLLFTEYVNVLLNFFLNFAGKMKLRTWGGVDYLGLPGGSNVSTEVLREGKWEYTRVCRRASGNRRGWSEVRKRPWAVGCGKGWILPRSSQKEHSPVKTYMLDWYLQDCKNKSASLYGPKVVLIHYTSVLRN